MKIRSRIILFRRVIFFKRVYKHRRYLVADSRILWEIHMVQIFPSNATKAPTKTSLDPVFDGEHVFSGLRTLEKLLDTQKLQTKVQEPNDLEHVCLKKHFTDLGGVFFEKNVLVLCSWSKALRSCQKASESERPTATGWTVTVGRETTRPPRNGTAGNPH